MKRTPSPLETALAGAHAASFDALDTYLLDLGTKFKKGELTESTYNCAEANISGNMKDLSEKYKALTGEPLSVFETV